MMVEFLLGLLLARGLQKQTTNNDCDFDWQQIERRKLAILSDKDLAIIYPQKFKIGEIVGLIGVYEMDAKKNNKPCYGKILKHFTDKEHIKIGASYNGYVVTGIGAIGEGALRKS